MIDYTKYNPVTGEIIATGVVQEQCIHLYEPCIREKCDLQNQYINVETKQPVNKPEKPDNFHEFNYVEKKWVLNTSKAISTNKEKRNKLLLESDWTQLADVDLTLEQKNIWKVYRQQLRDMTEADFIKGNFPNKQ